MMPNMTKACDVLCRVWWTRAKFSHLCNTFLSHLSHLSHTFFSPFSHTFLSHLSHTFFKPFSHLSHTFSAHVFHSCATHMLSTAHTCAHISYRHTKHEQCENTLTTNFTPVPISATDIESTNSVKTHWPPFSHLCQYLLQTKKARTGEN